MASSSAALPLKVTPSSTPARTPDPASAATKSTIPAASQSSSSKTGASALNQNDISSPHELTAFVETLLEQLDSKFDDMSAQMLDRMSQMSHRVDSLEASIQDIINGDISGPSVPPSPTPGTPGTMKRSGSGML